MEIQAWIWYRQRRLEDARLKVLRAKEVYERFGLSELAEDCELLFRHIEMEQESQSVSEEPDAGGQFPKHNSASGCLD
jgi:hypothetical protein